MATDDAAPRFQPGGTLREGALYVERPADGELAAALLAGELCYVLAPRQMGKSSLRARTVRRLRGAGVRCATVDLTRIGGTQSSAAEWHYALVQDLASGLGLPGDPADFWRRHGGTTLTHRFSLFLQEILRAIPGPIVLFLDEIDSAAALPFPTDDFFAAIRDSFNARADDADYARLTFCLLGVCTPGELSRDPARTPFNVGRPIPLEDFSAEEAAGFLPGLRPLPGEQGPLLDAVMRWTAGQPYMSQRLCAALLRRGAQGRAPTTRDVDELVEELFLRRGRGEDPILEYAERRALADERAAALLRLYRRLLQGEAVPASRDDPVQAALRLSGLGADRREAGRALLRVRNPIFAAVFDGAWVREHETARLLSGPLSRWLASGRSDDEVLRGQALEAAQAWARERRDLLPEEGEFLLAGVAVARREEEGRRQAERERERRRFAEAELRAQRRAVATLLCVVLILGLSLGAALRQYRRAARAEVAERAALREAEGAVLAERGMRAALLSKQPGHEMEALALALEALGDGRRRGPSSPAALEGLGRALLAARGSRALTGHGEAVMAAAFSPDGRVLATAAQDRTARLWDRQGRPLAVLRGHSGWLWSVSFSPDGERLVTASQDGTARLWDRQGRPLSVLGPHGNLVWRAEFSPDGQRVVTASFDATARVFDVRDGRELLRLAGHGAELRAARFSPDGARVLTAGGDQTLRLWDARSGAALRTTALPLPLGEAAFSPDGARIAAAALHRAGTVWLLGPDGTAPRAIGAHEGRVWSCAFSPDGRWLLTAGDDGQARLWDVARGAPALALRGHGDQLRHAAFSPDGERLVTAGLDGTARLWGRGGQALLTLADHGSGVRHAVFSPDGDAVLTASQDRTARLWSIAPVGRPTILRGHGESVLGALFSRDGRRVLTASADMAVRLWDAETGRPLQALSGHYGVVANPVLSPDGRFAATASSDWTARLWDLSTATAGAVLKGHGAWVSTVAFFPDGARLVTASHDHTARTWAPDGRPLLVLRGHGDAVHSATPSSDGRRVLTTSADGTARLWDAGSGAERLALRVPGGVALAQLSLDGALILTMGGDGAARLWDAATGAERRALRVPGVESHLAALSPDGRRVATAGADHALRLWDADSGRELRAMKGHQDRVRVVSFSSDGRRLLSASEDGTARLWDAGSGELLALVPGHRGRVLSARLSPDEREILTTSDDHTAMIYPAELGPLLAGACRLLEDGADPGRAACAPVGAAAAP